MSCRIHIDTPGPFYPGTDIVGKLICTFNERTKVKGIKLRAFGDEHTEWMSSEQYYNHQQKKYETRYVLFTGDNNIMSLESMLYGGSGESHLGPGTFSYPFSFRLPTHIPSTFENTYGRIKYSLKGIVDIPWAFDYEDKIYINVSCLIDLNTLPSSVHEPAQVSDEKTICCFCCASGPITMDVKVDSTAFTPGQNIHLVISIINMSNVNVDGVEAKLTQTFVSHVHSPNHETKHDSNTLAFDSWSGVGAHGENTYDVSLPIPGNISVPNLDQSVLFEVSYGIEVTASVDGCHSNLDIAFTVYLGTIPLIRNPPPTTSSGYPYAQNGYSSYPQPDSNPAYPQPSSNPAYLQPGSNSAYPQPAYPAAPSAPPNYSSVSTDAARIAKEKETVDSGGPASAPPPELPPPSYEDAQKNQKN